MSKAMNSRPVMGYLFFFIVTATFLTACGGGSVASSQSPSNTPVPKPPAATDAPASETAVSTEAPMPTNAGSSSGAAVSFENDVLPIFNSRCLQCHGGDDTKKDLSLASFEAVMAGSEDGPVVIPGDAQNSTLIKVVADGSMPKRGPDLFPEQIQILIDWVNAGAPDN